MIDAIIFDADDTLWATEPLYDLALDAAQYEVELRGIDGAEWRALQREIDLENVRTMGFSADRFPLSSRMAYERLSESPVDAVAAHVAHLSGGVFRSCAANFDDVGKTLGALRNSGYMLGLITKGEHWVQHKRLADSALAHHFTSFTVVESKSPTTFEATATLLGAAPDRTVSVGNSLSSDIEPAVAAGMRGFWIEAYVWEHEHNETKELPAGVTALESFRQIPDALKSL